VTLSETLREGARVAPRRTAVFAGARSLTYRELLEAIDRRADALGDAGGLVALEGGDPIAFLVDFFAARARGLPAIAHPGSCPEALRATREAAVRRTPWPSRAACVFYSSGSVGPARAVPLSEENLLAGTAAFQGWAEVRPDDRLGVGASPAQVFGLVRGALNGLAVGAEVAFFLPGRDPLADAASVGASVALLPAALVARAARHRSRPPLRAVRCGGGALPESAALSIEQGRGVPIRLGYGLTESAGLGSRQRGDRPRRPGSSGLPAPGLEVSIVGEHGEDRGPDETGEIRLRGPAVFAGYLSAEDPYPFDDRGRLRTGDAGAFDSDGELHVRGRLAYSLSSGDRVFCAEEVEAAIAEHSGVEEAAAAPLARSFGVLVVTREASDRLLEEIRAHARRRLPAFARPRRILAVPELPRTSAGKVDRRAASRWLVERS
jgi:long-chain acyl-CoA synthetase